MIKLFKKYGSDTLLPILSALYLAAALLIVLGIFCECDAADFDDTTIETVIITYYVTDLFVNTDTVKVLVHYKTAKGWYLKGVSKEYFSHTPPQVIKKERFTELPSYW